MNPYKALERIAWRFQNGKTFVPNEKDIEAYNGLAEFMDGYMKREVMNNKLFAKLYIHMFTKFLLHYRASPGDAIPQRELNYIVARPFANLFEDLLHTIEAVEMERDPEKPVRWGMEDVRYHMNMQIAKAIEEWK